MFIWALEVNDILKNLYNILKIDRVAMVFIYLLDFLASIAYIGTMWTDEFLISEAHIFVLVYSFTCGATAILDIFLLRDIFNLRTTKVRIALLSIFAAMQGFIILVDIAFTIAYGRFWKYGYLFIIIDSLLIISYIRRFSILKEVRKYFSEEVNKDD